MEIFEGNQLLGLVDRLRASFVGRDEIVQRGAEVSRTTAQTGITNGVATAISFNNVVKDTDAMYSGATPTRIIAPVEGWYCIYGGTQLQFTAGAAVDVETLAYFRFNGGSASALSSKYSVTTVGTIYNSIAATLFLAAGAYGELIVQHGGAGSTMQVPANGARFSMVRFP